MNIEHYDKVFALWKAFKEIGLSEADTKENISKFLDKNKGLSLVAKRRDEIVGALLVGHDGRRGYIHHLAVSVDFRRNGIGKELVKTALSCSQVLGWTWATSCPKAINFFCGINK